MCGIIGYVGARPAAETLLEGLGTLEYRGYDSAGIAVVGPDGAPRMFKRAGKLANLRSSLNGAMPDGNLGRGHTRWATHGGPTGRQRPSAYRLWRERRRRAQRHRRELR